MARTTIRTEDITASEVTTAKMATDPTNASNLSSGSVPTAQLGNVDLSVIEDDIALLGFQVAANGSLAKYNLVDQTVDAFETEAGVDLSTSTGEYYSSSGNYYSGAQAPAWFAEDRTVNTITVTGNVHTDTAIKKIGTASAQFDGTGDYLSVPPTCLDSTFGGNDFCIEFWMYPTDVTSKVIMDQGTNSENTFQFWLTSGSKLQIYLDNDGSGWAITPTSATTIVADTWMHVALVHEGSNIKLYLDGTLDSNFSSVTLASMNHNTGEPINIGDSLAHSAGDAFAGYLDELRISKTARYTGNFTPSTSAFTNDSNTKLLLHMDGANDGTTFTDSAVKDNPLTVSSDMTWYTSSTEPPIEVLVNGVTTYDTSGGSWFNASQDGYIRFDHGSGNSKIYTNSRWTYRTHATEGLYKWQGSADAGSWTDIGGTFTLSATANSTQQTDTHATMTANTTSYRYYQCIYVSGNQTNGGGRRMEMEFYGSSDTGDMVLVSNATTAEAAPSKGDIVLTWTDGVGTATLGTDLTAEFSADNGSTWTAITLVDKGTTGSHNIASAHDITRTSTSGTSMRWRVKTLNQSASKETRIQAVSLGWS